MKLENKNILLISPEPWDHIFVSKHHYATHLAAKGNKVFFLNPPSEKNVCVLTTYENLYSVDYTGFINGLRFLPDFIRRIIIRKKFEMLQKLCKSRFDLVWSFDNSVFFDFKSLPEEVCCISHIVDINQDFEFERAARTADICFGVIPQIVTRLEKCNPRSFLVKHAVQSFQRNNKKVSLPGESNCKVLYVGNLEMAFINWRDLFELASEHMNLDFIFVGSNKYLAYPAYKAKTFQLKNAFFSGKVQSNEIPKYLDSANILVLNYLPEYNKTYASPHKMMEYLASGKVIVTSHLDDYMQLSANNMLVMGNCGIEFQTKFRQVVNNLDYWNSEEKVKQRRIYALENTYDKQIDLIEKLINS